MSTAYDGDLWTLSAKEQADLVARREASPTEVVLAALDRMEEVEPLIHAFSTPSPEAAIEEARRQEQRLAAGERRRAARGRAGRHQGPDRHQGHADRRGSVAYRDFVPDEDDIVVERLKAAGRDRDRQDQRARSSATAASGHNPVFETTRNPWNLRADPRRVERRLRRGGGRRDVPVRHRQRRRRLGPHSLRALRPRRHQGLDGPGPALSRLPRRALPGISSWESLEHIGPMSRTVADGALMLSVIAGPDHRDRHSIPSGLRLAGGARGRPKAAAAGRVQPDWGYVAVDPEVRRVVGEAVRGCSSATSAASSKSADRAGRTRSTRSGARRARHRPGRDARDGRGAPPRDDPAPGRLPRPAVDGRGLTDALRRRARRSATRCGASWRATTCC